MSGSIARHAETKFRASIYVGSKRLRRVFDNEPDAQRWLTRMRSVRTLAIARSDSAKHPKTGGTVYFVGALPLGRHPIKIGYSSKTGESRLVSTQVGNPRRLVIHAEISGHRSLERWFHRALPPRWRMVHAARARHRTRSRVAASPADHRGRVLPDAAEEERMSVVVSFEPSGPRATRTRTTNLVPSQFTERHQAHNPPLVMWEDEEPPKRSKAPRHEAWLSWTLPLGIAFLLGVLYRLFCGPIPHVGN
jgi:hypothetical protein